MIDQDGDSLQKNCHNFIRQLLYKNIMKNPKISNMRKKVINKKTVKILGKTGQIFE